MASDVIESEAVLRADMNSNNGTPDFVTPRRTHEEPAGTQASSPASSGLSAEGDDEELDRVHHSSASMVEGCEEAAGESVAETGGVPRESSGARSSAPVSLPRSRSPPGPVGRSVWLLLCLGLVC